jgi:hypothetical protein
MKVKTPATTKTVSGVAKDSASQARETIKDARKEARRRLVRARIAAARARAGTRAKASGAAKTSKKAVGAAGAAGLAAGYFLDPESGTRRRQKARERALALIRRGPETPTGASETPAGNGQSASEPAETETQ